MTALFVIILLIVGIWLAADYSNDKNNKAELVGAIILIGIAAIIIGAWLVFLSVTVKFGQSERSFYMIMFFALILMR